MIEQILIENRGVLTAVLVAFIAGFFAVYVRRKNRTDVNTGEFVAVFTDFIHTLQTKGDLFPTPKMKELIKHHEMATIKLRNSLDQCSVRKFNRYWNEYKKKADKYYNAPAQLGFPATNKEMREIVETLIKKVKRL